MKHIEDFVVPWINITKQYNVDHISYAWKNPSKYRLMANENFHSPPEEIVKAVTDVARKGNLYPQDSIYLRERIAKLNCLKTENVFVANGSAEVIDVVTRIFIRPNDKAIIPIPTYSMYEDRVKLCGGRVDTILPKEDLTWDVGSIIERIDDQTRLIFINSPNNPLGSIYPENDLRNILDKEIPTVVDEAYYELEDEPRSMAFLLKDYSNLIIIRTMSKAWGMAGFRIGYSLASENIIDYLNRMRVAFTISITNMAAAIAALDNIEYFHTQNNETKKLRKELEEDLCKIKGLNVLPSSGNYILMYSEELDIKAKEVVDYLLKRGIQIRLMNKPKLGYEFFRITIGNRYQNKEFVKILQQLFEKKLATMKK